MPQAARAQKSLSQSETDLEVIERELQWIRDNDRFQFYEPCGPVEKFLQLVGNSSNLLYVLSAANGIGKTTVLVNIARALIFGTDNAFFRHPLFTNWPYPKRIRFVSDPSQVEVGAPFPTEIEKWWPKGEYQAFKGSHHYYSRYEANDWILEVKTYEQAPKEHEGANLGLVLFNEPPPKSLWTPNISRLRAGGIALVGMTPLTEAGWLFDDVVPRHEQFIVYADVEAACKQHGTRGHLEHDQIEKMIAEYDHDEREARIDGKAMYLKGLIYKSFSTNVHVLKRDCCTALPTLPSIKSSILTQISRLQLYGRLLMDEAMSPSTTNGPTSTFTSGGTASSPSQSTSRFSETRNRA
jgi:phage terminase large subunit-like protein